MKLAYIFIATLTLVIFIVLSGCTLAPRPEVEVGIKILARRLGYHGMKEYPEHFKVLGEIAQTACEVLEHKQIAIKETFEIITRTISNKVPDPLITDDLWDLVELMGLDLDSGFGIISLTPEQEKILEIVVCAFAVGVRR